MGFRPRILVAEGDSELRRILVTTMRHMGADPLCVENTESAQSLLSSEKLDGVFLDWDNNAFDPEALTVAVRKSKSNHSIPIAMLSAHPERNAVRRSFKAGTTFFLAKPFGTRELESLLNATRGAMLEERRRYQRINVTVPILCEWKEGRRTKHVAGKTINISTSGVLLKLNPQPETGVAVVFEFTLPQIPGKLSLKGVVARIGPGEIVAARFLSLTKPQQDHLERFISDCPSKSMFATT